MWNSIRQLTLVSNTLCVLLLGILTVAGCYWIAHYPGFALRRVQINGDIQHISVPAVRTNVAQKLTGNFFTVDLDVVRAAFEQMPWVRYASVRRVWPNTLAVTLKEYQPLGTWGGAQLVSDDGKLFRVARTEMAQTLPAFDGPEGSAGEVVRRYGEFTKWFAQLGAVPQAVALSPRYAWTVKLSNGVQIELGKERHSGALFDRSKRLVAAWSVITQQWGSEIEYVDLRYPNGFAIRTASMRLPSDADASKK